MLKKIIIIQIFINIFYIINAEICGTDTAGVIIQQISTENVESAEGLYWNENELLYVDRYDPAVCFINEIGYQNCTKITGIKELSSVYPINKIKNKLILVGDRKVILLNLNLTKETEIISFSTETITTVTNDESYTLSQSTVDGTGRLAIESNLDWSKTIQQGKIYGVDDTTEAVTEMVNNLKYTLGLVFTKDDKFLFVADAKDYVVYKYDYDSKKGTLDKREVVFNVSTHINFQGYPCTLEVTKDNQLWISMCEGGTLILYDWKKHEILQVIQMPASYIESLCYGTSKYDVLFAGTNKFDKEIAALEPGAGAVYAISGTGTVGFEKQKLNLPTKAQEKSDLLATDGHIMTRADIEKMFMLVSDEF